MGLLQTGVGVSKAGRQMLCGHRQVTKPLGAEANFHQAENRRDAAQDTPGFSYSSSNST